VQTDEAFDGDLRVKLSGAELLSLEPLLESLELGLILGQTLSAGLLLVFDAAYGDVVLEVLHPSIDSDVGLFGFSKLHRSERGEVLGVLRNLYQLLWIDSLRKRVVPLFPHSRDAVLPAFDHASNVGVWPAKQQHVRAESVAARQNRKVLPDD